VFCQDSGGFIERRVGSREMATRLPFEGERGVTWTLDREKRGTRLRKTARKREWESP